MWTHDPIADLTHRCRAAHGEHLVALALFGSQARGDARPDSDVDLFLIAEDLPESPIDRHERAVLHDLPPEPVVQIVARTPEEFLRDITPLDLDLAMDARILHDRDGFLGRHLEIVRARIAEAGLVRAPDLSWTWARTPRVRSWAIGWDGVRV